MYCRIRENFTTNTTTIDDVTSQGDKNIMLTDADGNISLVKFSDTVIKLQQMIDALNDTVKTQAKTLETQATTLESLSASAIKNGDKIKIMAHTGFFLNNCGSDPDAPCGGSHYVSSSPAATPENNQWTIQK